MKAVETLSRGVQSMGAPTGGPDCRALAASPIKTGSGRGLTPKRARQQGLGGRHLDLPCCRAGFPNLSSCKGRQNRTVFTQ